MSKLAFILILAQLSICLIFVQPYSLSDFSRKSKLNDSSIKRNEFKETSKEVFLVKNNKETTKEVVHKDDEKELTQNETNYYSIYYNGVSYEVFKVYDETAVAIAVYTDSYNEDGWGKLNITTNKSYPNKIQAYGAGFLEGWITHQEIYEHWFNQRESDWESQDLPENVQDFLTKQDAFIQSIEKGIQDLYSSTVLNTYYQFLGMIDGYNKNTTNRELSLLDFHVINSSGDLTEVKYYKAKKPEFSKMTDKEIIMYLAKNSHCSSLIKINPDFTDLWFGHNTWTAYLTGTRLLKTYELNFNDNGADTANVVSFSSYPGSLSSIDDFYITSKDLVVMETTNPLLKEDLFDLLDPNTLLTWHRTIVANRLSKGSQEWTDNFKKNNSGTYNNQFIILDLNKVDIVNKVVSDQALLIIEQIPGYTEVNDVTKYLKAGFWPSYNIPYSEMIREKSGYEAINSRVTSRVRTSKTTSKGDNALDDTNTSQSDVDPLLNSSTNYYNNSRANIFRRDASGVRSLEDMKRILTYNNYHTDSLTFGHPGFTLASRYDLETDSAMIACMGAIDAKIGSIKEVKGQKFKQFYAIAGPPSSEADKIEKFEWSKSKNCSKLSHLGMNDRFSFDWITFNEGETKKIKLIN